MPSMSSIQSDLMSKPLPLADAMPGSPKSPSHGAQDPEKVAKDFESVFASMMLKEMRKSLEPDSLFGEDKSDIYGGMFDQFLGEHIGQTGGIGLAKMIREALERATPNSEKPSITQKSEV
jgi:flagellar protein FlgJ